MDAATLATAMACPRSRADRYIDAMNTALAQAGCTTVNRAAGFLSQVGHETLGLLYQEELASGAAYNGRKDLNNTQPGDGPRFKGRGWIQLTGRGLRNPPSGYTGFSAWCHSKGLVDRVDYFVQNPKQVADPPWSGLAASWYWTVARPKLNSYCDAGDILSISRAVNGWVSVPNGYQDRVSRWNRCRGLGNRILPTNTAAAARPAEPGSAAPALVPAGPPPDGDVMRYVKTPEPAPGTPKNQWPTERVILAFRPDSGVVKVDHGGRGGWIHLGRWWVRRRDWNANQPFHDPQDHPGIREKEPGVERFVGYGWETAGPTGADMIEIVLSAPDGAIVQYWRTK